MAGAAAKAATGEEMAVTVATVGAAMAMRAGVEKLTTRADVKLTASAFKSCQQKVSWASMALAGP